MLDVAAMRATLAPPHRAGYPFILGFLAVAALGLLIWSLLVWVGVLGALFSAFFFRDPDRVTPAGPGLVVAPADGRIVSIAQSAPPAELGLDPAPVWRVAIFLSVLDVHINRSPVAGRIKRSVYVPGAFVNAALDKASEENERRALVIEQADGTEIAVVQIAGLIARRIVTFKGEGESVGIGERFGLIRFGSRVDVYLPPGRTSLVAVGQLAIGGETVIADLKSAEPEREARAS